MPRPRVVWLTGLSGAGKSTLAEGLAAKLRVQGERVAILDGDALRRGLCSDLGFTAADRVENIRRTAEVARLMLDQGLWVVVALISPFRRDRSLARARFAQGDFVEVYVDAPLALVETRDPKGLYARARRGELREFTGIDSPYEPPESPELRIETGRCTVPEAISALLVALDTSAR